MGKMTKIQNVVIFGKAKIKETKSLMFEKKPSKKYRILIQERKSSGNEVEKMRSFMIYDFRGNSTVDSVKKKLFKSLK